MWYDSTGFHQQNAALVDYKTGIVHLSSSDGTLLEIPEGKLSPDDISYVRSQDIYKKRKREVVFYLFRFPVHLLILFGAGFSRRYVLSSSVPTSFRLCLVTRYAQKGEAQGNFLFLPFPCPFADIVRNRNPWVVSAQPFRVLLFLMILRDLALPLAQNDRVS